ncbi:MAG: methyltransferase domain-containing protein [Candidatus Omnitrophica bacterium]|nr:methyltransferase domain-containing protein [Candidatus Omnitrophota bacterium]
MADAVNERQSELIEHYIGEAIKSFTNQNFAQAESFLRKALNLDPRSLDTRYHMANLFSLSGRYREALEILQPFENDPRIAAEWHWYNFKDAWQNNDFFQARAFMRQMQEFPDLPPDFAKGILDFALDFGCLFLYGRALRQVGAISEKRDWKWIFAAGLALRLTPNVLWRSSVQKYVDYFQKNSRWRKVHALLSAAHFADSKNPFWMKRIGQASRITRDVYDPQFQREKICYESVLRKAPRDREALDGLLLTLNDMGAWGEIQRLFDHGIADASTPWHRSLEAMNRLNLGERQKADDLYRRLEEIEPEQARFCRGLIALEEEQYQKAADFFQQESRQDGCKTLYRFFHQIASLLQSKPVDSPLDGQKILDAMPFADSPSFKDASYRSSGGACALCGWTGERRPLWRDARSGWVRVRCPKCSMISVDPIPSMEAILELYKQPAGREKSLFLQAQQEVKKLAAVDDKYGRRLPCFQLLTDWGSSFSWREFEESLGEEKRFLDVGCSAGRIVRLFHNGGWRSQGIDVDPDAVAFARSQGLNVRHGTIESLKDALAAYHFITLIDVIEHVQDPAEQLSQIYEILEPGGLFYLKTPCADSLPHRFLGDSWLESCEHLHFFSRKTIVQMVEQTGFQIVGVKQLLDETTPFLHPLQWKQKFFPHLFNKWIFKAQCGDMIMILARKSRSSHAD